jgi:hypothetical protein
MGGASGNKGKIEEEGEEVFKSVFSFVVDPRGFDRWGRLTCFPFCVYLVCKL